MVNLGHQMAEIIQTTEMEVIFDTELYEDHWGLEPRSSSEGSDYPQQRKLRDSYLDVVIHTTMSITNVNK